MDTAITAYIQRYGSLMFQSSSDAAPPPPMAMAKAMDEVAVTAQRRAVQEDLGDLKLYRVPMRVNVNAKGQKQVEIGTATGRERGCQLGKISMATVKTKKQIRTTTKKITKQE